MRPGDDGGGDGGAFNAQVHVDTWVEPSDVTLSFDRPLMIRDVWNAYVVDDTGVQSTRVVFRLKKQVRAASDLHCTKRTPSRWRNPRH